MKSFTKAIVIFALLGAALSTCGQGCLTCGGGKCYNCFQSKVDANGQCQAKKNIANCDLNYIGEQSACGWCTPGFSYDKAKKQCIKTQNPIVNCRIQYTVAGRNFCGMCGGGKIPNKSFNGCVTPETPIDQCLWHVRVPGNVAACNNCKAGYVASNGKCFKTDLVGCIQAAGSDLTRCGLCDGWNGYRQVDGSGKCVKASA